MAFAVVTAVVFAAVAYFCCRLLNTRNKAEVSLVALAPSKYVTPASAPAISRPKIANTNDSSIRVTPRCLLFIICFIAISFG